MNETLYNPPRFKTSDKDELFELIYHHPFATIISQFDNKQFISHLPLTPIYNGNDIELIGHLATANPHSQFLQKSQSTVIFNGPHAYISPSWYAKNDVPTWNYIIAHAQGPVQIFNDYISIESFLKTLTLHVETLWPSGWEFFIPEDLRGPLLEKNILGFKIKVSEFSFKKKLSQNRSPSDRHGILKGLAERLDDNSIHTLLQMKEVYLPNGEAKESTRRSSRFTSSPMISKELFDQQLEQLVHHIWRLQDRLGELSEFEKQWEALFLLLKNKTGVDCSVHIQNHNAYQTFHWDKYQIILSDLVSLIGNELDLGNKKSVFKQTLHHLKLLDLEEYIQHDIKVHFSRYPHQKITEAEKEIEINRIKLQNATDTYDAVKMSLKNLFPNIASDFVIKDTDIKDLLFKIEKLAKELKSARHLFNHKLEETAHKKHTKGLKSASLENITRVLNDTFQIVRDIGMVFKQTSFASYDFGSEAEIEDQIDIILFGSIPRATSVIYEKCDNQLYYSDARKLFYESDAVLDFVSNLPSHLTERNRT